MATTTPLYRVPTQNNQQYTLDSQIAAGASSLTLNQSVAGIIRAPGVIVIDRIDSSGSKTASKREYKTFTGVSGANLTGLVGGLAGSTDQVHSVGAIVEVVADVLQEDAWYNVFTSEHDVYGAHISLPSLMSLRSLNVAVPSMASLTDLNVGNSINLSGASFQALPIRPTWVIKGVQSAATLGIGTSLSMPESGTIQYVSITNGLGKPVSTASLLIDINKNATSIFTDQNTRPGILGGGTYVSTASIGTKTFNRGDVFSIDVDNVGNQVDFSVQLHAR